MKRGTLRVHSPVFVHVLFFMCAPTYLTTHVCAEACLGMRVPVSGSGLMSAGRYEKHSGG